VVGRHQISTQPAPEDRWGTLVYINEADEKITEKVPVGCAHYERIYDSIIDAISGKAEKCVMDEEVVRVLEILQEATRIAKSHEKV
jgi:predicted dehydrogenase